MNNDYSFSQKFVEGEITSGFWNLALYGVNILNSFAVVYFLSVYEYGLYQLILSVVGLGFSLTGGFLDDLVLSDLSRYSGKGEYGLAKRLFKEYAFLELSLGFVLMVSIILGAGFLAAYYGKDVAIFLRLISIVFIFGVIGKIFNVFFKSQIYFSAFGVPVFGEIIKFLSIMIFVYWQGLGIFQVLIAYIVGQFASSLFALGHFMKLYNRTFRTAESVKNSLIRNLIKVHGIWIFLRYFFSRIANNIRPWIIKLFIGTEAVGLFAFARNIISVILRLLPLGTFGILLPRELENKKRLHHIFARTTKYSAILGLSFMILSLIFIPIVVRFAFPKYNSALPLFIIMVVSAFLYSLYKIFRMILIVFKEQRVFFMKSLDQSILSPLFLFILLPIFGVAGAAIEWVITYAVTTILFYCYLSTKYPYLRLKFKEVLSIDKHDVFLIKKILKYAVDNVKSHLKMR